MYPCTLFSICLNSQIYVFLQLLTKNSKYIKIFFKLLSISSTYPGQLVSQCVRIRHFQIFTSRGVRECKPLPGMMVNNDHKRSWFTEASHLLLAESFMSLLQNVLVGHICIYRQLHVFCRERIWWCWWEPPTILYGGRDAQSDETDSFKSSCLGLLTVLKKSLGGQN